MMEKRHYNNGEAEFMLDPVNDTVVKVTHRNQVGWIGISLDWDVQRPYTFTTSPRWRRWLKISDDGVGGFESLNEQPVLRYSTPDEALRFVPVLGGAGARMLLSPTGKGGLEAGESGRKKGIGEAGAPRIPE